MINAYMHDETRTTRPFALPVDIDDLFAQTSLRFGKETVGAGASIVWEDPETYGQKPVELVWYPGDLFEDFLNRLQSIADALSVELGDLAFVVTATTRYLRVQDVVAVIPLDTLDESSNTVDLLHCKPDAAGLGSGVRGGRIDAYLLLWKQLERTAALRPWRKGTWLVRTHFTIATDHEESLFRPLPLTTTEREEEGLSPGVMRHVKIRTPVWEDYDPDHPPIVYVDADTLSEMAAHPKDPVSRILQAELACVFLRSVLTAAYARRSEWENGGWETVRDSLLGRVLRAIVGRSRPARDYERELRLLAQGGTERLASEGEAAVEVMRSVRDALRGGR